MRCLVSAASVLAALGQDLAGTAIPMGFRDCGDESYKMKIASVAPDHVAIGETTTITAVASVLEEIRENVTFESNYQVRLQDCAGDVALGKTCKFPLDTGHIRYGGFDFPVRKGEQLPVEIDVYMSRLFPALASSVEITAVSKSKGLVFCLMAFAEKAESSKFIQGVLDVTWQDCGGENALLNIDRFGPSQFKQGDETTFIGRGTLLDDLLEDDVDFNMRLSAQLVHCQGDLASGAKCHFPMYLGYMQFSGLPSPIPVGDAKLDVELKLSSLLPSAAVNSVNHVTAKTASGDKVFCLDVRTAPEPPAPTPPSPEPAGCFEQLDSMSCESAIDVTGEPCRWCDGLFACQDSLEPCLDIQV